MFKRRKELELERKNKKSKEPKSRAQIIITAVIIAAIVLAVYGISFYIGGDFHEFCEGAIVGILIGIGIAAFFSYLSRK